MKTIVWDVDDVLNDLTGEWLDRAWRSENPGCAVDFAGLAENPPHRALGVPLERYLASLDAFRLSEAGSDLPPRPEALDWFGRHGPSFRHMALTATPMVSSSRSAAWVMRHFGRWIRSFHFVPSARPGPPLTSYDRDKGEFLAWFGKADLFVDDNAANVDAARRLGIPTLLFPRPWNGGRGDVREAFESVARAVGD